MSTLTPLLPIFVKLQARPCLVVGAGAIGLQKVNSLLECDADVTVVAPKANEEITALARAGKVRWHTKSYAPEDLEGAAMVIAATNNPEVNHAVYRDATVRGIFANAVDDPPFCDFYFSSVVRRGPLQIAISTAGESPAFAQRLREELQRAIPEDVGRWLSRLGQLRRQVLGGFPAGRDRTVLLKQLAQRDLCDSASCPSRRLVTTGQANSESWWLT